MLQIAVARLAAHNCAITRSASNGADRVQGQCEKEVGRTGVYNEQRHELNLLQAGTTIHAVTRC